MKKSVLIVDDDNSILKSLSMLLQDSYELTLVRSGNEAIEKLKNKNYSCVISDFYMDNGDGLALLKENKSVPTIIMTGHGKKEIFKDFANNHAYHVIEKPVKPDELEEVLARAVKAYDEREQVSYLAKIGENTGKVIHDINNPLSLMMLAVETTKARGTLNEQHQKFLNRVEKGVSGLKSIVENFREEFNSPNGEFADAHEVCLNVMDEWEHMLSKEKVKVNFKGSPAQIFTGPVKLRRAIENLIKNSVDAMSSKEKKEITLEIKNNCDFVSILVSDTGPGLSPEIADRLFTKGGSTKSKQGSGLGLWGSRDNLRKTGGDILLNRTSSEGVTFEIRLRKEKYGDL